MNTDWLLIAGLAIALAMIAVLIHRILSADVPLLDTEASARALDAVLHETPMTPPPAPSRRSSNPSQRIFAYLRLDEPDGPVEPTGLRGWWPMDRRWLSETLDAARADLAGVLSLTPSAVSRSGDDDVPSWMMMERRNPAFADHIRQSDALHEILQSGEAPEHWSEVPTNGDLSDDRQIHIELLTSEATLLADQVDAYVSKRQQDEPWRLAMSRTIASLSELRKQPSVRGLFGWIKAATNRLREALDRTPVGGAVLDEIQTSVLRLIEESQQVRTLRHWFADPAVFEAASADALAIRNELAQLEAALSAERAEIAREWQARLSHVAEQFTNQRNRIERLLDDVEERATEAMRDQADIDPGTRSAMLKQASTRIGNPRFGMGRKRVEDWQVRAERSKDRFTEDVLMCVIAVPDGEQVVRSWLQERVDWRAGALYETAVLMDDVRAAALGFAATQASQLANEYDRLQREAELKLKVWESAVEDRLELLKAHLVRLEAWASGESA